MKQYLYKSSCHCQSIRFQFMKDEIKDGLQCNCSICIRRGSILSTFLLSPEEIDLIQNKPFLGSYSFASHKASHYFCKNCGIYMFHSTLSKPGFYRINLGCIEDLDIYKLSTKLFNGKRV